MVVVFLKYFRLSKWNKFTAFVQKLLLPQTLIAALSGRRKKKNGYHRPVIKPAVPVVIPKQYNLEQIAAFASGEQESLRQILVSFLKSGKQNALLFKNYLHEKNENAISELSHKMLPLFRQLEAYDIVELLSQLEQKTRTGISREKWHAEATLALDKIEQLLVTIQREEGLSVY